MKDKLNIPSTIVVGCRERSDTYSGKLAYVIYIDEKGKLRKEKSWQGWRDQKIEPENFNNVPTEGFVLNKKAGGDRYGWNPRQTYCRVFDPRGFEFEVTIPNLLFILQECSSVKGKGLEGEFVYAWDRTDLVLLPVGCPEYVESMNFTNAKSKKVTKTDMTPGCLYKNKDMQNVIYLGRYHFYEKLKINYSRNAGGLQHVFVTEDGKNYWPQKGFTKLAEKLTDDPIDGYSDLLEKFINGERHLEIKEIITEVSTKKINWEQNSDKKSKYANAIVLHDGKLLDCSIQTPARTQGDGIYSCRGVSDDKDSVSLHSSYEIVMGGKKQVPSRKYHYDRNSYHNRAPVITMDELHKTRMNIVAILENGNKIIIK